MLCLYLFFLKERRDKAGQLSPAIITSFLSWISARGKERFRSLFHLQNASQPNLTLRFPVVCNTKQDTVDTDTSRFHIRRCNYSARCQTHPKQVYLGCLEFKSSQSMASEASSSVPRLLLAVSSTSPHGQSASATGTDTHSSKPALINLN